jgi:hypothetical protein
MTDINDAIASMGSRWIKQRATTDPAIDGTIVSYESRNKTFEGAPVLNRKTGQPRVEWVFTLQTSACEDSEDDGVRRYGAAESCQRAIAEAVKQSGHKLAVGGRLQIAVIADPATDREQPTFKAKYTPPAPTAINVPAVNVNDIFGDDAPF